MFSLVGLSACGGGGGGDSLSSDLQGRWVSQDCVADGDQSFKTTATISGSRLVQSNIRYTNNSNCSGDLTVNTNLRGQITVLSETTETTVGTAKHANLVYQTADITGSAALNDLLETQGTTLQDFFTAEGVTDITNVPLNDLIDNAEVFSIYLVSGSTLRVGDDSAGFDGTSPQMRHREFSDEVFEKQ
jgi:hypothetical protein